MNVCKRFSIILVALGLFLSVVAITSIPVLATEIDTEGTLVTVKGLPQLPDTVKPGMSTNQLSNDMRQAIIDKAMDFYFPNLTGYSATVAKATLSAALKLYEEKKGGDINGLQYFLKSVALYLRSLTASAGSQSYLQWRSAGDVLLQVNSKLADTGIVDGVIDWNQFSSDTALTAVRKFIDPSSGEEKTEERPATSSDVSVTSDVFKEYVESANTNNAPKGKDLFIQSYRSDKYIHAKFSTAYISIWDNSEYNILLDDLYLNPFYMDSSGNYYYSDVIYHLYYKPNDDPNSDIMLWCDVYTYIDSLGFTLDNSLSNLVYEFQSECMPYCICLRPLVDESIVFNYYSSSDDFLNGKCAFSSGRVPFKLTSKFYQYHDAFSTVTKSLPSNFYYYYSYDNFSDKISDVGFICSHSMISRSYADVDTSKIPDNYYVTITGDTIYDYSITNPETGQSDTINYYITNNYTLPDNGGSSGGGSGSSGSVGGDVTVGGKIDVDGTVSVDVNVNVNGGAGGTNFGDVNTDPLDDYLNSALDESSGFRAFLGDFFSFLPVELLVLLGIGLSFVIIGRIMGR